MDNNENDPKNNKDNYGSNDNNPGSMSPRPKKSPWSSIIMYLLVIGILVSIVFMVMPRGSASEVYTYAQLSDNGSFTVLLKEKEVTKLVAYDKQNQLEIVGSYKTLNSSQKSVTVNFECVIPNTATDALNQYYTIVKERKVLDDSGNPIKDSQGNTVSYYNGKILVNKDPYQKTFWDYVPWLIMIVGGALLLMFTLSRVSKAAGNSNRQAMDYNSSRARREDKSRLRFRDVAGCDEVKGEFIEIVDYLKHAEKYRRLGAKLPKGILLVGPPGTGKTLMAKAVAGEANVPFFSISGSDFVEMFVGVGAGRVRDMFKKAKQSAPCILFIDEIDAVGRQRGAGMGGGNDEREQTLNQLLVEMDGFNDESRVIVLAATNRSDVLDPALLRPGRFDRQITLDLPDRLGRKAILEVHAKHYVIGKEVDFDAISKRTVGLSGADLANILNEAAILAVRGNEDAITMQDLDEALDRNWAGPAKYNSAMSEEEKKIDAYHEAGHAVIGLNLPGARVVEKVTIVPRGQTGGHVLMLPSHDHFMYTKQDLMAEIISFLGGRTSEEIFFDDITTGASNDIENSTKIARRMVTQYGMSKLGPIQYEDPGDSVFLGRDYNSTKLNFSNQIAVEIDQEIRSIIEDARKVAREILEAHKEDVVLVAETLLKVETLNSEDILYLIKNRKLPDNFVATRISTVDIEAYERDKERDLKASSTSNTYQRPSAPVTKEFVPGTLKEVEKKKPEIKETKDVDSSSVEAKPQTEETQVKAEPSLEVKEKKAPAKKKVASVDSKDTTKEKGEKDE